MTLIFAPGGTARCLYSELINLQTIGTLSCTRASSIEFNKETQEWTVCQDSVLFSSPSRAKCLAWEQKNLQL